MICLYAKLVVLLVFVTFIAYMAVFLCRIFFKCRILYYLCSALGQYRF